MAKKQPAKRKRAKLLDFGQPANAYALLAAVCKAIMEEPLRYNQTVWIVKGLNNIREYFDMPKAPACGTVACVAGWAETVAGRTRTRSIEVDDTHILHDANDVLFPGLNTAPLFHGSALYASRARIGTREYARAGCAHIRRFMAEHKAELKAITYIWKRDKVTSSAVAGPYPHSCTSESLL